MVRVRFAPSPTGPLHIGGLRTALYNYLFAKAHQGSFILRIEDTDQKRYVPGAEDYIMECLKWAGLKLDEGPLNPGPFGPYRQSERADIYKAYAQKLIDAGRAYYAFDSAEELAALRQKAEQEGKHGFKYSVEIRSELNNSLSMSESELATILATDIPRVIRLKVEPGKLVKFDDIVRGRVEFNSNELDDKVLMKADGLPTYHMANVIDDYLMEISHVIRGEEWLSSTAHHVLLYQAFGWEAEMPKFAHLPLILKPVGKGKLSKRDGAKFGIPVFPIDWTGGEEVYQGFREAGFLPEGTINFLAFLGWNPGTEQELFSLSDLVKSFSLDNVVKSGARFDFDKAIWFNEQHIKQLSDTELLQLMSLKYPDLAAKQAPSLGDILPLIRERLKVWTDLPSQVQFFYEAPSEYDEKMCRKKWKPEFSGWYDELIAHLGESPWDTALEDTTKAWIQSKELGLGKVLPLLRLALCGKMAGPSVFDIMLHIGRDESIGRLEMAKGAFVQAQ